MDDYEPFRRFVPSTLCANQNFLILGEAQDGLETIQRADTLQPDLVLLDIGLPKMNGLEAARAIREIAPQARILFLTQESSPDVVHEALQVGGSSYVLKTQAEADLLRALQTVLLGRQFLSDGLQAQVSRMPTTA